MSRSAFRINSAITVESRHGAAVGKRWMELLAAIGSEQSITAAAKSVGMSYKAAWDAVEAMNNLADRALVERVVGGKGGGGTRLTANGERLVATYREVESENARFLDRLNARIAGAESELKLIGRLTMLTSARNHLAGIVVHVATGAVNDEVELELSGGDRIVAIITHESRERMNLKLGDNAIALIKASSVIVAREDGTPMKLSARNQLKGTITRVEPGAVNAEVVIALSGGNSVAAIITNTSASEMKLAEGMAVMAIFKASSVILGIDT